MSPDKALPARFLALGDSYTIGEGVAVPERWPNQLAAALRGHAVPVADPRIIATTGWTTDELAATIAATELAPPYDLVSLLIGVNNQYRGRSVDNYRDEFDGLLQQAIAFAGGNAAKVFVVSIPDWGVTSFASSYENTASIAAEIDAFNAIARELSQARGAGFVDITDLTRSHRDELVDDALHPSAKQYARWVERILPRALSALRNE